MNGYNWSPESWQSKPYQQIPDYKDTHQLKWIKDHLGNLPPIIPVDQIQSFQQEMIKAAKGEKFVLQVGDCAETFKECNEEDWMTKIEFFNVLKKFTLFQQTLSKIFSQISQRQVVLIGRICGQFGKPRSESYEQDGTPTYRGDQINGHEKHEREFDPNRMSLSAMYQLAGTKIIEEYQKKYEGKELWISHECLNLHYEEKLVRKHEQTNFLTSLHFPWIGNRTRASNEAHVHFLSHISNPLGVKIGQDITQQEFVKLNNQLNPQNLVGKLFVITRIGIKNQEKIMAKLIKWKKVHNLNISWMCDPMHGNTYTINTIKTRNYNDIQQELKQFFDIMIRHNEIVSGIHLEVTPYQVTECIDQDEVTSENLNTCYLSMCDPRLNQKQTLKIIEYVAGLI